MTANGWAIAQLSTGGNADVSSTTATDHTLNVAVIGCGVCYQFRIQADCYASSSALTNQCDNSGKCSPASDEICSPACMSGASGEQCGVRGDGTYRCTAQGGDVVSGPNLLEMFYQTTATSSDSKLVNAFLNINFNSATATMWKEPGFANAFPKAFGETLGEITNMPWLNSSIYIGNIYLCSNGANGPNQGCNLGSQDTGVSIQALVDCGTNTDCVTNVKAAYLMLGTTDTATQITYANDFMYRLLYYMSQDTYNFENNPDDTTYATTYSNYKTLGFTDMTLYVPTSNEAATDVSVNPMKSDWMPNAKAGTYQLSTAWQSFTYPCGITEEGTVECLGYYEKWVNGSFKVTKQVAPLYRSRKFKMISSDQLRTCGITHNDRLICWGYEDFGRFTSGSLVFPCGWTKNVVAKVRSDEYEMEMNQQTAASGGQGGVWTKVKLKWRWKYVSVGGGDISGTTYKGTVCGVRQDGKGFCFGCNEALGTEGNLQDEMPDDFEWQKIEVSKDAQWAVGWAEDGQARAWGVEGQHPIIPEGIYFKDIPSIVGSTNRVVCGLQQADGKLLCFGHYKATDNKIYEIKRNFQNDAGAFQTAANAGDTSTASAWTAGGSSVTESSATRTVRGFRTFSKWGCGDYLGTTGGDNYNSANCIKEWDGWNWGSAATDAHSCTNVEANYGSMTPGGSINNAAALTDTTDFKFSVAPGVPYSTAADDDDLVAVADSGGKQATVTFVAPSVDAAAGQKSIAGYQVYVKGGKRRRRRRAGKWKMKHMVANTNTGTITLTVKGLQTDEKYKFRVRAFSKIGGYAFGRWSESSNSIYTPKGTPEAIQHFWWEAARSADDYLLLNWYTPESAGLDYDVTYFKVNYKVTGAASYTAADIYPRTNQNVNEPWTFVEEWINGLSASTSYLINVAACNTQGCGTATSDITATTNSSIYETAYAVKTNMSLVCQWCSTTTDCGTWITTDTWSADIEMNFILSIVYWLQWHSTYYIEYTYAHEGYSAYAPTPAPSSGAISPTILSGLGTGLTVRVRCL